VRIAAQVRDTDVVAPDDEDVRLIRLRHFKFLSLVRWFRPRSRSSRLTDKRGGKYR
jgi:hypothetical protein